MKGGSITNNNISKYKSQTEIDLSHEQLDNDDVDKINFYVFDTFILTQDTQSNLMISIEQDFSVED